MRVTFFTEFRGPYKIRKHCLRRIYTVTKDGEYERSYSTLSKAREWCRRQKLPKPTPLVLAVFPPANPATLANPRPPKPLGRRAQRAADQRRKYEQAMAERKPPSAHEAGAMSGARELLSDQKD
jgi:hypothetical protein